jgi:SAM-dependent methyltransferase
MEARKQKEVEHSDKRRSIVRGFEYDTDASTERQKREYAIEGREYEQNFSNMKFYSISRSSFGCRDQLVYERIEGAKALDYCCGNGEVAIEMARRGAVHVTGIDLSPVAIENASRLAAEAGVSDRCVFKVMDAENMEFEDGSFDVIHEYGALHHLNLDAALCELSRVLKPSGRLVCTEALRHNPFIHWYRKRTPHLRTKWECEHILGVPEIRSGRSCFDAMKVRFFHFAALGAVPFRRSFVFAPLLTMLELVDSVMLRIPLIRRWAWVAVITYEKPRSKTT